MRITKEAGIAQSGFYMHFKNMDDCIGAAAEQISEGVRATIDASRKGKLFQYRSWADLQRTDVVAAHFDHVLRTYEEERGLTEILLRYVREEPEQRVGIQKQAHSRNCGRCRATVAIAE